MKTLRIILILSLLFVSIPVYAQQNVFGFPGGWLSFQNGAPVITIPASSTANALTVNNSSGTQVAAVDKSGNILSGTASSGMTLSPTSLGSSNYTAWYLTDNGADQVAFRYSVMQFYVPIDALTSTSTAGIFVGSNYGAPSFSTAPITECEDTSSNVVQAVSNGGSTYSMGNIQVFPIMTPSAPTLATAGTPGTTTYYYKIVAVSGTGLSLPSAEASITTGNATLSATNYVTVTVPVTAGVESYNIYRGTSSGAETLIKSNMQGAVLSISTATYYDQGAIGTSSPPTVNSTGAVNLSGTTISPQGYSSSTPITLSAGYTNQLANPGSPTQPSCISSMPTLSTHGTAGTTTYGYRISANGATGVTLAGAEVTIATGNASLTGSNYITVTLPALTTIPGAVSWNIYGRTSGSELLMATGITASTWNDTGSVTPSGALPSANTTGTATTPIISGPGMPSQPRIASEASGSTAVIPVGGSGGCDEYEITALAATCAISTTGTPWDGEDLFVRIKDNGTAQTLSWTGFTSSGVATLPTTTTAGKTISFKFKYDSVKASMILLACDTTGY